MIVEGLAASLLTAIYSILLPSVTLHSATAAAGCLFFGLLVMCLWHPTHVALPNDIADGGVLFVVFALYQYFMREAFARSPLSIAIVNTNLIFVAIYQMYCTQTYSKLVELFSAGTLFILVSIFLATTLPPSRNDIAADASQNGKEYTANV